MSTSTIATERVQVYRLINQSEKAIAVQVHRDLDGSPVTKSVWLPKSQIRLSGNALNGWTFYVPEWLLTDKGVAPFGPWAFGPPPPKVARHIDCIFGDLCGVLERIQEGAPTNALLEWRAELEAELAVAQASEHGGSAGPYLPPGYEIDPDFEGAPASYDGEAEIAGARWDVPLQHPHFWQEVERKMIEGLDPRAVRALR